MDSDKPETSKDPRSYFAAERTLLAWIRTGIAMMGFGFVVARFGLFLQELAGVQAVPLPRHLGLSLWVGVTLILVGVSVNICAAAKHWQTVQRLIRGEPIPFQAFSLATLVALLMGALGLVMASYLVFGLSVPAVIRR